jgi:hypothetical protein
MIERARTGDWFKYLFTVLITACLAHSDMIKRCLRFLDHKINMPALFDAYFDEYKPIRIFAPDVFGDADVAMLKTAKRRSIRAIGMVLSWDNNTSKGLMRAMPDRLIVQNEIIREESIRLQGVRPSIIVVSGIPHFEYYKKYKPISRHDFMAQIKGDSTKKTILISPAGDKFIGTDWHIFEILKRAYKEGKICRKVQFLIRLHPTNKIEFGGFIPDENFIIENPGVTFEGVRSKDNELNKEAVNHLADTLTHCDVVINVLSSIVIDASIFNKSVITIGFNGYEKDTPFIRSVGLYLTEENMARLLKANATPVVKDEEELIRWINAFLEDPRLLEKERKTLVQEQCWSLDGQSAKRIAKYVIWPHNNAYEK